MEHQFVITIVKGDITIHNRTCGTINAYRAFEAACEFFETVDGGENVVVTLWDGETGEVLEDTADDSDEE